MLAANKFFYLVKETASSKSLLQQIKWIELRALSMSSNLIASSLSGCKIGVIVRLSIETWLFNK